MRATRSAPMTRRVVSARPMSRGSRPRSVPKESHVGAAQRDFVELGADGHAHIGAAQRGRVVHAVAHHHDRAPRGLLGPHHLSF